MIFLSSIVILIIGILLLVAGFATNKKWLKSLSVIPIALSIFELIV